MNHASSKCTFGALGTYIAVGLAFGATVTTSCVQPTAPAPQDGVVDVQIDGLAFDPLEVTIRQGETVRWTNLESGPVPHTVTSGNPDDEDAGELFDSGIINPGDAPFERQFDDVGEFVYYCRVHPTTPGMFNAKVIVIAP